MRLHYFLVAAAMQPFMLSAAYAQHPHGYITGNELMRRCAASAPKDDQVFCVGYVAGVADYLETLRSFMGVHPCLPPTAELGQAKDVLMAYIDKHPETRDQSGATLAVSAFPQAWKCDKP
ncbi:MAG TPA: Rap1a/Tai family immunity protein [Rhizomicrobium sp.]|jgi:hypothetical protein|nr:Rap1a/Tai family immunity protein [Rhizomicrobium sp.]